MKVTVTIDPHFQEEGVAITGPQPSERIQKVQQFIEELDQKERLRAKKDGETYLVETHLFHRFYILSQSNFLFIPFRIGTLPIYTPLHPHQLSIIL